jgi:hypothetical protein
VGDDELAKPRMLKETAAAAVTKLRTDLPDVASGDIAAAQGAMGMRAQSAVIDENVAQHVGPPPELPGKNAARFSSPPYDFEDSLRRAAIPSIAV